jgi:arabinose-5-phosphate isomerase
VLDSAVDQEACPLNLAPTASTTAQMALGDALAVALLDARGFRRRIFARSHPGGSAGPQAADACARPDAQRRRRARVPPTASFTDLLREMTGKGLGSPPWSTPMGAPWASSPTATCAV